MLQSHRAVHSLSAALAQLEGISTNLSTEHLLHWRLQRSHTMQYLLRSHLVFLQLSTIIVVFCLRASATCYYPNGTADNTNSYLPCNTNGQSMCCATGPAIDLAGVDSCRDDGFCIPFDNNGIWRRLCTDQTWKDPACINLCVHGACVYIFTILCMQLLTLYQLLTHKAASMTTRLRQ